MPEFSEESLRKIAKQKVKKRLGLEIHLAAYIGVNVLLLVVNLLTYPKYLWVFWPMCAWAVGIALHVCSYLVWLMGVTGGRIGVAYHATAYVSANLFLIFAWANIWYLTNFGYPWFLYPLLGWLIALIIHAIVARPKPTGSKTWVDSKVDQEMEKLRAKGALPAKEE
jgi:hypothetical protein